MSKYHRDHPFHFGYSSCELWNSAEEEIKIKGETQLARAHMDAD